MVVAQSRIHVQKNGPAGAVQCGDKPLFANGCVDPLEAFGLLPAYIRIGSFLLDNSDACTLDLRYLAGVVFTDLFRFVFVAFFSFAYPALLRPLFHSRVLQASHHISLSSPPDPFRGRS